MIKNKTKIIAAASVFLSPFFAHAEHCSVVEVLNDQCGPDSVKVNLSGCKDSVIAVTKVVCKDDQIRIAVRGKDSDFHIVMKKSDSWGGKGGWSMSSEKEVAHRNDEKTLPKTEHEREAAPAAAIVVPAAGDAPADAKPAAAFTFSGYLDVNYGYNFNKPSPETGTGMAMNSQNNMRSYDYSSGMFDLSLAELTIKHVRKETAFVLDLDFGKFADINSGTWAYPASGGPNLASANELTKHIGQAVLTYTPAAAPSWVFEIGKMPTHVGLELMKAKDNWNYSRSALFSFGGPFWHTGAHIGYTAVPSQLVVSGYVYNGWNSAYDNNLVPTYGAQVKWTPTDKLTWIYNYIGGPEQTFSTDTPESYKNAKQVHETNISYTLTPTVSLATSLLYGTEKGTASGNARWAGAQLGAKWQTSPTYYLSPRVEVYSDSNGWTLGGTAQTLMTYTLTQSYQMSEGLELRLEGRLDHSTASDRFITKDGTSSSQPTVMLGVLYTM